MTLTDYVFMIMRVLLAMTIDGMLLRYIRHSILLDTHATKTSKKHGLKIKEYV